MYINCPLTIEEIPEFNDLLKKVKQINHTIEHMIEIVDPSFYLTDEQMKDSADGEMLWFDPKNPTSSLDPRSPTYQVFKLPVKAHCLNLMIRAPSKFIDKLVLEHNLQTTANSTQNGRISIHNTGGMFCSVCVQKFDLKDKVITKGKYYDVVLKTIRQIDPYYTEEELIGEYVDGDGDIAFNRNVVDSIDEKFSSEVDTLLFVKVVTQDIKNNVDKILDIARSYTKLEKENEEKMYGSGSDYDYDSD